MNKTDSVPCYLILVITQDSYYGQLVPHSFHFIVEEIEPFVQDHSVTEVRLDSRSTLFQRQLFPLCHMELCFFLLLGQQSWDEVCLQFSMDAVFSSTLKSPPFPTCFQKPLSSCCAQLLSAAPRFLTTLSFSYISGLTIKVTQENFQGWSHQDLGIILRINCGLSSLLGWVRAPTSTSINRDVGGTVWQDPMNTWSVNQDLWLLHPECVTRGSPITSLCLRWGVLIILLIIIDLLLSNYGPRPVSTI